MTTRTGFYLAGILLISSPSLFADSDTLTLQGEVVESQAHHLVLRHGNDLYRFHVGKRTKLPVSSLLQRGSQVDVDYHWETDEVRSSKKQMPGQVSPSNPKGVIDDRGYYAS